MPLTLLGYWGLGALGFSSLCVFSLYLITRSEATDAHGNMMSKRTVFRAGLVMLSWIFYTVGLSIYLVWISAKIMGAE